MMEEIIMALFMSCMAATIPPKDVYQQLTREQQQVLVRHGLWKCEQVCRRRFMNKNGQKVIDKMFNTRRI